MTDQDPYRPLPHRAGDAVGEPTSPPGPRDVRPIRGRPIRGYVDGPEDEPAIVVSAEILARHGARVLDPATAERVAGQDRVRATVYLSDALLVSGVADDATHRSLGEAAAHLGVSLVEPPAGRQRREGRRDARERAGLEPGHIRYRLRPAAHRAATVDAWAVLQHFRASVGDDASRRHVALDHLLAAAKYTHGSPVPGAPASWASSSSTGPTASYGMPGWGGRQPVSVVREAPARSAPARHPVVVVLDTGVGYHDWLREGVSRGLVFEGQDIGLPGVAADDDPDARGLLGLMGSDTGHGTFIAGLIRQTCPDADILSIPVMAADGMVPEHVLLETLEALAARQHLAQAADDESAAVDVVCLSLGYYHEQPADVSFDPLLWAPLADLASAGVPVVVAAGNDATTRPMFPAAFAPYVGCRHTAPPGSAPLVGIGAENPDGSVALFSNAGPWVTCTAPGVSLVSTMPTSDASLEPENLVLAGDGVRASLDMDRFTGFGVWSGTSFAAPVIAGRIARELLSDPDLADVGREAARARAPGGAARDDRCDPAVVPWPAVPPCAISPQHSCADASSWDGASRVRPTSC